MKYGTPEAPLNNFTQMLWFDDLGMMSVPIWVHRIALLDGRMAAQFTYAVLLYSIAHVLELSFVRRRRFVYGRAR